MHPSQNAAPTQPQTPSTPAGLPPPPVSTVPPVTAAALSSINALQASASSKVLGKRKRADTIKYFENLPEKIIQKDTALPFDRSEIGEGEIGISVSYQTRTVSLKFVLQKDEFVGLFNRLKTPKYLEAGSSRQSFKVRAQDDKSTRMWYFGHTTSFESFLNTFIAGWAITASNATYYLKEEYLEQRLKPEVLNHMRNLPLRADPANIASGSSTTTSTAAPILPAQRTHTAIQQAASGLLAKPRMGHLLPAFPLATQQVAGGMVKLVPLSHFPAPSPQPPKGMVTPHTLSAAAAAAPQRMATGTTFAPASATLPQGVATGTAFAPASASASPVQPTLPTPRATPLPKVSSQESNSRLVIEATKAAGLPDATEESVIKALEDFKESSSEAFRCLAKAAIAARKPGASVWDIILAIARGRTPDLKEKDRKDVLLWAHAFLIAASDENINWTTLNNKAVAEVKAPDNPNRAFLPDLASDSIPLSHLLFITKRTMDKLGESSEDVHHVVRLYISSPDLVNTYIQAAGKTGDPIALYDFLKENHLTFFDPTWIYSILMAASNSSEQDYNKLATTATGQRLDYLPIKVTMDVSNAAQGGVSEADTQAKIGQALMNHGVKNPKYIKAYNTAQAAAAAGETPAEIIKRLYDDPSITPGLCLRFATRVALLAKRPSAAAEEIEKETDEALADPKNPLFPFTNSSEANFFPALVNAVFLFGSGNTWIADMIGAQFNVEDKAYMQNLHSAVDIYYNTRDHQQVLNFLKNKAPENFADIARSISDAVAIIAENNRFAPPAEDLQTRFSHERWMDIQQGDHAELWHPDHVPLSQEIFQTLWNYVHPGRIPPEQEITYADAEGLITTIRAKVAKGQLSPDYELPFWLFHVKCATENVKTHKLIDDAIAASMERMPVLHKGMVAKFASLIDTAKGSAFRTLLYPSLYRWSEWCTEKAHIYDLDKNQYGWYSVQDILRRQIEVAQELIETGVTGFARSRYQDHLHFKEIFNSPFIDSFFFDACKMHIAHCHQTLEMIGQGIAKELPKFYHGISTNSGPDKEVIPQALLEDNAKLLPRLDKFPFAPNYVGTFVSTRQADWGPPYLAFGDSIAWRDDVVNLSYERSTQRTEAEYWVGFGHRRGIPIALKSSGQQHQLVPVAIVSADPVRQREIVHDAQGLDLPIQGTLSALIEQYCMEQITPFHCPKHWPNRATKTREDYFQINKNNNYYRSNLAFTLPQLCHSGWGRSRSLTPLMTAAANTPEQARQDILNGSLTPGTAVPALRRDRELPLEETMRSTKEQRRNWFKEIAELFPGSAVPPPLRHLYEKLFPCTPNNDELYGTVVGYDLGLVLNSYPVMLMLFDKTFALWSGCSEEQKDGTIMGVTAFYTRLSHEIIKSAEASNQEDTILVPFASNSHTYMVGVGPDTFAISESHGRDARTVSTEPGFIHRLYGSLSKAERKHLQAVIDGAGVEDALLTPQSRKRVEHINRLLQEMGEGILKRYFTQDVGRRALPQRLDNKALQEIFNDKTLVQIQEEVPMLTRDYQINHRLLDSLHTTVNFYKKRDKLERSLWNCCGRLKYSPIGSLDEVAARMDDPAATPTADLVIAFLTDYEENKAAEGSWQILDKAIGLKRNLPALERARLERMSRQLEVSHPHLIESLISLNRGDNYRPVKGVLEQLKLMAESYLRNNGASEQAPAYADWLRHIDSRLEKIAQGKRVELSSYYQAVRADGEGGSMSVHTYMPPDANSFVCYPSWIKHLSRMAYDGDTALAFEGYLKPFVHHTQSNKRRRLATAVIGDHSDPDAAIPIMTRDVAIIEKLHLEKINTPRQT